MIHKVAIAIKAVLVSTMLRTKPIADKANTVQANISPAIAILPKGARNVPCCDDSIICIGARANINQRVPPHIQSKCHTAAADAITPALNKNFAFIFNSTLSH